MNTRRFRNVVSMIYILAVATGIGMILKRQGYQDISIILVIFVAIQIIAWLNSSKISAIISSILGTLLFNYFFTSPHFSLQFYDRSYFATFVVMTSTAVLMSILSIHERTLRKHAQENERLNLSLFEYTQALLKGHNLESIATQAQTSVEAVMGVSVDVVLKNQSNKRLISRIHTGKDVAIYSALLNEEDVAYPLLDIHYHIMKFTGQSYGVIAMQRVQGSSLTPAQVRYLQAMSGAMCLKINEILKHEMNDVLQVQMRHEKNRSLLLQSISHDLRTPLAAILGTSDMLYNTLRDHDHKIKVGQIMAEIQLLQRIADNILNLIKLQDGAMKASAQLEPVDELMELAYQTIKSRHPLCRLEVQLPQEMVLVMVDSSLMLQVLINLIENAYENDNQARIKLSAERVDGSLVIRVSDSGTGLSPTSLEHFFEPYHSDKLESNSKHLKTGIGIGLAICKMIVDMHQGVITIEKNDTLGCTFAIKLKDAEVMDDYGARTDC
ncbi:sensor histidine kinase [Erysipelothrix aquatica]|uniref:sensor histidine kinase n=1 Tax=Erysipelothrix aquatica TaxID=2683714 RepID=UPI001359DC75|nr:DUF4118 domain-containing protein [Erysipelothrix aquatica]